MVLYFASKNSKISSLNLFNEIRNISNRTIILIGSQYGREVKVQLI